MKKSYTFLPIYFIVICTAAAIARYMQFVSEIINFKTGFFVHYAGVLKYIHYGILLAGFVGLIILAFFDKRHKTSFFIKRLGHFDDGDVSLCGIMFMLAGFAVIFSAYRAGFTSLDIVGIATVVLGALTYGFAGGILLFGKRTYPSAGIMLLGVSGFYIVKVIVQFLGNYIIINMSEHLIRLLISVLLALFYLSAGRMFLRAENKTTRYKAFIFGFSAAILAVSEITAKLIYWFGAPSVTRASLVNSTYIIPDTLAAAEAIALLVFLTCLVRRKKEASYK